MRHTDGRLSVQARRNQNESQMTGCPILRAFAKGGIAEYAGDGSRGQSSGIPPFAKSAKDGAPDHLWQSKR